jgi:GWxTD domain-containing protein
MKENLAPCLSSRLATILLCLPCLIKPNFANDAFGYCQPSPSQHGRLDSLRTKEQYLVALSAADSTTLKNEFETEFLLLLNAEQRQSYDSLASLVARKVFIENYWKASNPNPLLPEIDWLLEILRRRAFARENFPAPAPPYFDDRGKYYFKYGKPSHRFEDAGGFDMKTNLSAYPNESWAYENVTRSFLVHFARVGKTFREIEDLTDILITNRRLAPEARAAQWSGLITKRAAISPVLGSAYAKLQELATAREHAKAFANSATALTVELAIPHTIQLQIAEGAQKEILQARQAAPVAAYNEITELNKLRFTFDVAQFRGPKGTTRLEVAVLSPFEKNLLKKLSRDSAEMLDLGFGALLRDRRFEAVAEDRMRLEFSAKLAAAAKFPNAVGTLTMTAFPRTNELTLQVKEGRQGKIGFSRQMLDIRDFGGRDLMMSDIQLLTAVTDEAERQILPVTAKLNTAVACYPFEKIRKTIPLLCYFEIYNLKSSGITDNYEVVYKVISEKGGDKNIAVSVSYTRPVTDDTAPELIGIDLRQVPKGTHRLEITVTGMNNRNATASVQKEIRIED